MKAFLYSIFLLAFITAMSAAIFDKIDRSSNQMFSSTTGNVRPPATNADG